MELQQCKNFVAGSFFPHKTALLRLGNSEGEITETIQVPAMTGVLSLTLGCILVVTSPVLAQEYKVDCQAGTPIPFQENGRFGYLIPSGVVIPAQFDLALNFVGGVAIACVAGSGCGPIGTSGRFLAPLQDRHGLIPMRYSDGIGAVSSVIGPSPLDQLHGYVDLERKVLIPLEYEWAGDFNQGIAVVHQPHKAFFIDHTGKKVTPEFEDAYWFSEGLAPVKIEGKWGYIHRDGSMAIAPQFEGVRGFSEGLAAVVIGGKFGYIDASGKVVVEPIYTDAFEFSEGLAVVLLNWKWGYIGRTGKQIVPIQYRLAGTFREGLAPVQLDNKKWGYIDKSGHFEIQPIFDYATSFCAELASVAMFRVIGPSERVFDRGDRVQGRHGIINRSGKYVWRDSEDQIWDWP